MSAIASRRAACPVATLALLLAACGGGSGAGDASAPLADGVDEGGVVDVVVDVPGLAPVVPGGPGAEVPPIVTPARLDPLTDTASYRVTLDNLWGAEDFPQGFPEDAHLSLVGGAMHDERVSFWKPGATVSRGMEDIAETGMIDVFLNEDVVPAIRAGTAGSIVEAREYTDPMVDGVPGRLTFDIEAESAWPLLTLATMLGPSPDWFVGVHGLALDTDAGWVARTVVELPLYDGGSKSDIQPVMGGPDIIPPLPIGLVAYDDATGTYLPSDGPQIVARLTLERVR